MSDYAVFWMAEDGEMELMAEGGLAYCRRFVEYHHARDELDVYRRVDGGWEQVE